MPESTNKGLIMNYFDCLRECRGEFITDCSGDDYWTDPLKIDHLTKLLDSHAEASVAFSDWDIFDENSGVMTGRGSLNVETLSMDGTVHCGKPLLKAILNHRKGLPYNLTASLYRREPVMKILENSPLVICNTDFGCEDVPIMAALASVGGAIGCPVSTYTYFINDKSITGGDDMEKMVKFFSKALHCSAILSRHYGVDRSELKELFYDKSDFIISNAFNSGDRALMEIASSAVSEWELSPSLKTKIQQSLARSPFYSLSLNIKRQLKKLLN